MSKHVAPKHGGGSFTCPYCNAITGHKWNHAHQVSAATELGLQSAICQSEDCGEASVWVGLWEGPWPKNPYQLIYPVSAGGPPPNDDLSKDVRGDFDEARNIVDRSPRGAAALLRLALQKLCRELGYKQNKLKDAVDALITKERLPDFLQQALCVVRVVGNESVHPGQMDMKDDRSTAIALFGLVNLIAERLIGEPEAAKAIFESLPESKKVDMVDHSEE